METNLRSDSASSFEEKHNKMALHESKKAKKKSNTKARMGRPKSQFKKQKSYMTSEDFEKHQAAIPRNTTPGIIGTTKPITPRPTQMNPSTINPLRTRGLEI